MYAVIDGGFLNSEIDGTNTLISALLDAENALIKSRQIKQLLIRREISALFQAGCTDL